MAKEKTDYFDDDFEDDIIEDNEEKGFYYMAKETGTLWEHMSTYASCNHGFASYIAVLLKNALEARVPKAVILSFFYPETSADDMSKVCRQYFEEQ